MAFDPVRNEVVLTRLRAERAEAALARLRVDRDLMLDVLDERSIEIARLRGLLARQQAQIGALTERLRALEAAPRQLTLDAMVRALGGAIEAGDDALEGRAIVSARAEIKAALHPAGAGAGLVLGRPGTSDPRALSTVSFDLLRLPPDAVAQERGEALAAIVAACQQLQRSLDGDPDPDAATTAAVAALAAQPPASLEQAAAALEPLAGALRALAQRRSELEAPTVAVERLRGQLGARPQPAAGRELAAALEQVARELERPSS